MLLVQSCHQQRISQENWQHSHTPVCLPQEPHWNTTSTPKQPHQPACTVNPDSKTASSHTCLGATAGPSDRHTCCVCAHACMRVCGPDSRQQCSSCKSIRPHVAPSSPPLAPIRCKPLQPLCTGDPPVCPQRQPAAAHCAGQKQRVDAPGCPSPFPRRKTPQHKSNIARWTPCVDRSNRQI